MIGAAHADSFSDAGHPSWATSYLIGDDDAGAGGDARGFPRGALELRDIPVATRYLAAIYWAVTTASTVGSALYV